MATPKAPPAKTGRVEQVDPKQLTIALNVRGDTKIDGDFVESIRQVGILQPPMVTENNDGGYDVVLGQRRTLGAIEAGLTTMPVYVVSQLEADAARIIDQLTENDQREQLSDAERLGGFRQLSLFGLKPADMVKRTARPKAEVDRYLKVLSSESATQAVTDLAITLEDAEALAEFDKDPAAQKKLLKVAGTGQFRWELQSAQRKRDVGVKVEAAKKKLEKDSVRIVTKAPENQWEKRLGDLATPEDPHTPFTPESHASCPGHVALVDATEYNAGTVSYFCEDPEVNGHVRRDYSMPKTPEQIAAIEAEREAQAKAKADEQSAANIRRGFITDLLTSAKQPADLAQVFPRVFLLHDTLGLEPNLDALVLLDIATEPEPDPDDVVAALKKTPRLAVAYPAAVALAALEETVRYLSPGSGYRWEEGELAAREYFTILQEWGYELTDHEKQLLAARAIAAAQEAEEPDDDASDEDQDDISDENTAV